MNLVEAAARGLIRMPDTQPIRVPSSSQRVELPPRRRPKPADPCAMVIFGAGGDLTKRLVVPALYNLAHSDVLPENFALIGVGHGEGTTEQWRDSLYDMLKSFVGNTASEFDVDSIDQAAWTRLADKMTYIAGDFTKPEVYGQIRDMLREAEKSSRHKGQRHLLPGRRRPLLRHRGRPARQGEAHRAGRRRRRQAGVLAPRRDREAVRPQRAVGARSQCRHPAHAARGPDLPHRPLPRQGHRAEHHGVPLRQRPVRADLESRPHRSCADHRCRDGRRRNARQVLRGDRRAARHGSQPCLHPAVDGRHGAADLLRRRCDPQQEGRGAGRHARRSSRPRRCAASTARAPCWARR